jgi:hypothetical protein
MMGNDEDRAKLTHLVGHWIEHNRSHEASYTEWAARARAFGGNTTAKFIDMAVEHMEEADAMLGKALAALKG